MTDPASAASGRRILIVEDEYFIAMDLAMVLEDLGFEVVGPAASVAEAMALVERFGDTLDGAILDVNLRNERVYPVADALQARGVHFVFASGYDARLMPEAYADVPRCGKPIDRSVIVRFLGREAPAD